MRSPSLFSLPKSALQVSKYNRPLLYNTFQMSTGIPSQAPVSTAAADSITENRVGGSGAGVSASELGIENTNINTAAGVNLNERQKVVVGSVLDVCCPSTSHELPLPSLHTPTNLTTQLFAGRPSLHKLSLWSDTATFADPITLAEGRKQYAAQWYGLQAAFSSIERIKHEVTSAGNPIEMNLSTKYTVKGIGKEQRIDSVVKIWTERDGGEGSITKVEDKWNGEIPEGAFAKVSVLRKVVNPWWWVWTVENWIWWCWSLVWWTWWWRVSPWGRLVASAWDFGDWGCGCLWKLEKEI